MSEAAESSTLPCARPHARAARRRRGSSGSGSSSDRRPRLGTPAARSYRGPTRGKRPFAVRRRASRILAEDGIDGIPALARRRGVQPQAHAARLPRARARRPEPTRSSAGCRHTRADPGGGGAKRALVPGLRPRPARHRQGHTHPHRRDFFSRYAPVVDFRHCYRAGTSQRRASGSAPSSSLAICTCGPIGMASCSTSRGPASQPTTPSPRPSTGASGRSALTPNGS